MKNKKLTIVDLENFEDFKVIDSNILFINKGKINYGNSKILKFNINNQKKFKKLYLEDIENFFQDLKNKFQKKLKFIYPQELEIFNLRNDKITYIEKLCLILYLKKFRKKFNSIDLITDSDEYSKIYSQVFKNITIKKINQKKNKLNFSLKLNYYKFLIKSIYFIILSKIIIPTKGVKVINKILSLSIYPFFFDKKNNISIYDSNNGTKLNFSLTDETHLNLSFKKYVSHLINLKKIKNILIIENFIKFTDYFIIIKKFHSDWKILDNYLNINRIKFRDIEIKDLIIEHIWASFLNRYKLSIYDNALERIFKNHEIIKFNYFLFEYSFGFYLLRILKKKEIKLNIIGYQHGFFSKYLLWLNGIKNDSEKNIFLPNKIICNQRESYNIYKKYIKNVEFKPNKIKKQKFPKISNKSKNILVFPGQHDLFDIYNFFLKNKNFLDKNIFIKLHPNNKKKIVSTENNIKIVNSINYKLTYKIYLSPTTTMTYIYKKLNKKFNLINFNYKFNLQ